MKILSFIILLLMPTAGNAFCMQSTGFDFASSVNGAIDWLVCLHNEQKDTLNSHANTLNIQADELQSLTRTVNTNAQITDQEGSRISDLQRKMDVMSSENDALKVSVSELERLVASLGK